MLANLFFISFFGHCYLFISFFLYWGWFVGGERGVESTYLGWLRGKDSMNHPYKSDAEEYSPESIQVTYRTLPYHTL